jgi:hypothetical protein
VAAVGVEVEPVQVGVQGGQLVLGGAVHPQAGQDGVPPVGGAVADGLEGVVVGDLQPQVLLRLRQADQRGGHAHGDDRWAGQVRLEPQVTGDPAGQPPPQPAGRGDGAVERGVDEQPAGALGQSTADVGVAGEDAGHRVEGEPAVAGDVVEDEGGVLAGEGEPEDGGVVGRRDLGDDAAREPDAVVVRAGQLVAVAEGESSPAAP